MIKKKKVSEGKNSHKNYVQTPIFETEIQNATIRLNNGEKRYTVQYLAETNK